jgi:hypothetical protein
MPHLNFKNAMRQEHCERAGCDVQFTTGNYKITTTPRQEWQYIVENVPCPDMEHKRRLVPIGELLQLDSSKTAKLCEEEVIAIVLYTGPMFQIYNTILRRYPAEKFELFEKGDNQLSTTIFVLVSAVQKLSRFTRIPLGTLLYRGLGGRVDLPDIFFQIDEAADTRNGASFPRRLTATLRWATAASKNGGPRRWSWSSKRRPSTEALTYPSFRSIRGRRSSFICRAVLFSERGREMGALKLWMVGWWRLFQCGSI